MIKRLFLLAGFLSSVAGYNFDCNLSCLNGGKCTFGAGDGFGSYTDDDAVSALPWSDEYSKKTGMYCTCPSGYTGLQCEIAMVMCDTDTMVCFNGNSCAKMRSQQSNTYWWRCQCDIENSIMTASYAESYCRTVGMVKCTGDGYCLNGGKCGPKETDDQLFVTCECPEGYAGDHCEEYLFSTLTWGDMINMATSRNSALLIATIVIGSVFCVTGVLYYYDKKQKKKRRKRRFQRAGIRTDGSDFRRPETELT
eukprot:Nitzschia sp. Nitz4//scaffold328_size19456//17272//18206//NITZ4_008724-RA/size19456-augustus-gene-0.28-mRNA-1//-1//CDS//3329547983//5867//frame0